MKLMAWLKREPEDAERSARLERETQQYVAESQLAVKQAREVTAKVHNGRMDRMIRDYARMDDALRHRR